MRRNVAEMESIQCTRNAVLTTWTSKNLELRLPNQSCFRYAAGNTAFNTLMQNLKNLRLHNYPFGDGDWRAADQFEQNDPQKETISELEQISKLSLYLGKEDWSTDIPKLRKAAIAKPEKIGIDFIFQNLTNIRFTDDKIEKMGAELKTLKKLEKLTFLTTNKIDTIEFENLPCLIQQFSFMGCELEGLSWSIEASKDAFPFVSIIHLGFGQNRLQSPLTDYYLSKSFFPNLRSIDLSENNLSDLESFIHYASTLKHLQAVNLSNNPLYFYTYYRPALITDLNLIYLDDVEIPIESKKWAKDTIEGYRERIDQSNPRPNMRIPLNFASLTFEISYVMGIDNKRYGNGNVRIEVSTPFSSTISTEPAPVSSSIIFTHESKIDFDEHFIVLLRDCYRFESEETAFTLKIIFTPSPEKPKKGGKGGKEAKPKKGAKGKSTTASPEKTPTQTPDIPVDEIIACRTFHLSRDKSENLIHCGGGPLVMGTFVDPLEVAREEKKPKKKKEEGAKGHQAPLLVLIKTAMTSVLGGKRSATTRSPPVSATTATK